MRPTVTDVVVNELKITSLCVFACLLVTSVIPAETFDATFYSQYCNFLYCRCSCVISQRQLLQNRHNATAVYFPPVRASVSRWCRCPWTCRRRRCRRGAGDAARPAAAWRRGRGSAAAGTRTDRRARSYPASGARDATCRQPSAGDCSKALSPSNAHAEKIVGKIRTSRGVRDR